MSHQYIGHKTIAGQRAMSKEQHAGLEFNGQPKAHFSGTMSLPDDPSNSYATLTPVSHFDQSQLTQAIYQVMNGLGIVPPTVQGLNSTLTSKNVTSISQLEKADSERSVQSTLSSPVSPSDLEDEIDLDSVAEISATSLNRQFLNDEKADTENCNLNTKLNENLIKRGILDEEATLLSRFGIDRNRLIQVKSRQECGDDDEYNRNWLEFLKISPSEFITKNYFAAKAQCGRWNKEFCYEISTFKFPMENVLNFIPFGLNVTYGMDKYEDVIVKKWLDWAQCRDVFKTEITKNKINLYTFKSIEFGLMVAAYRIAWMLTEGMTGMEWKYYSPESITFFSGAFESKFTKLAEKFDLIKNLIEKEINNQKLSDDEANQIIGWDKPQEEHSDDHDLVPTDRVVGWKKSTVRQDSLQKRFKRKLHSRLSILSREFNSKCLVPANTNVKKTSITSSKRNVTNNGIAAPRMRQKAKNSASPDPPESILPDPIIPVVTKHNLAPQLKKSTLIKGHNKDNKSTKRTSKDLEHNLTKKKSRKDLILAKNCSEEEVIQTELNKSLNNLECAKSLLELYKTEISKEDENKISNKIAEVNLWLSNNEKYQMAELKQKQQEFNDMFEPIYQSAIESRATKLPSKGKPKNDSQSSKNGQLNIINQIKPKSTRVVSRSTTDTKGKTSNARKQGKK